MKTYPRLVTVDIVGYGQDTPYRDMKAYDLLVQAESGLCSVTGTPDAPCKVGVSVADMGTGLNAYSAILEALIERSRTGRGKAVEISMFDSMAEWMSVPLLHLEHAETITRRHGLAHASIYPYRAYSCTDGDVLIAVQNAAQWAMFCTVVLGEPALENDARFATNAARVGNREALDSIIEVRTGELSMAEFVVRLEDAGIAYARLGTVRELSRHPALHRQTVIAQGSSFSSVASPIAEPGRLPVRLPAIGEHTEAVREEFSTALVERI
jgi:crotonobetainyl-CoA:carnitine CoA-transferase CaiB-like acyl-CoA transferase